MKINSTVMLALAALIVSAGLAGPLVAQALPEETWTPPPLSGGGETVPDGRDVIRRMGAFMSGQKQLLTEALVTYEAVQQSGQKLHFDLLQRMAVRRPDALFWMTLRDDGTSDRAWFRDGQFTLLKQPANRWAQLEGPQTIVEIVAVLTNDYKLNVPFRDLLTGDPTARFISDNVDSVEFIGEVWVEGHWTDHVAIRKPGFDIEIWVRKGPEAFPAKITVVFLEEDGQPVYSARFRKWATSVPENVNFEFKPPAGAERIEVIPVPER